jgi:hypothetical protein
LKGHSELFSVHRSQIDITKVNIPPDKFSTRHQLAFLKAHLNKDGLNLNLENEKQEPNQWQADVVAGA